MNAGRHNGSQEIFRALIRFIKAQEMKRVDPKPQISTMLILTLNNLGCCYKRYDLSRFLYYSKIEHDKKGFEVLGACFRY